jgi:phosphatidylinositol-3-phosphatase
MSIQRSLKQASLLLLFLALSVLSASLVTSIRPTSTATSSAPAGTYFNHIVIIAMENEPEEILGSSSTPFLNSLMAAGSTMAQDDHYPTNENCSAGCYVDFTTGLNNGDNIGDGWSCCVSVTSIVDQVSAAGLTWQAYCAEGCPRGLDHFPFEGYSSDTNSPNIYGIGSGPNGGVSVTTSTFIAAANSANPPNYLWYTPTDSENMHDNSISSGDSYLQSFLVGTGTVASPAAGSLLASNLFTNPSYHTLLWIWWDECGTTDGGPSCDSNSNAANVEYGSMIKPGYVSQSSYNEFSELATIESNWGLGYLGIAGTSVDGAQPLITDIFTTASTGPGPLSASFTANTSSPVSGENVTFTATASGGTSPYSYSWTLGGSSVTGNPVTKSFTNGTYTISLTVQDSAGGSASSSQVLTVLPATSAGAVPELIGWGGVRMDESVAGTSGQMSAVFPGEYASNMELLLIELKAKGYNTVRVDFDPYCTDTVDFNYMSVYSQTNAQRAVEIAQYYGFWIILDYHGYSDIFRNTSCWLSYWKPIVQNIGPMYSQIIWEPENEPDYTDCANSPSSCPAAPCSTDASCVTYLSSAYQQWISQARSLGDDHWIVVQNLCSYSCGFSDMAQGYPTVTDPLGGPSSGGRIFISLHSYMDYSQYSSSWNNATAESLADQYYNAVVKGVANTGWPALNTEGGTDTLACDPNMCGPDIVLDGSAGYTVVTFHFIQTLVNLYDSNSPQRINWVWWPAGSWTNTPNSSPYGAMTCNSNPIGWGCLLQIAPVTTNSSFAITTSTKTVSIMQTFSQNVTIELASVSGFSGTVDLSATVTGTGIMAELSSQSQYLSSGSVLNMTLTITTTNSTTLGNYLVTVTATDGALSQSLTIPLRVNILGDILGDGMVNVIDICIILSHLGTTPSSPNWDPLTDLNHDGVVNLTDFEIAASNFDKTPPS